MRVGGRLAIAAIALALLIVGCGGGSGSSATGQTEPTHQQPLGRAELIARADAICVAGQRAFARVSHDAYPNPRQVSVPNPRERLPNVEYAENMVTVARRVTRRLAALTPPAQLREPYEAYVKAVEEVKQLEEDALQASNEDNGGKYFKARKTRDAGKLERANLAEAVGLKKCSPNPFFK